jgi:hypothetical protein
MKNFLLLSAGLVFFMAARSQITFQTTFNDNNRIGCLSVIPESDSGFTFLVSKEYYLNSNAIVRTDKNGTVLFSQQHKSGFNVSTNMIKTLDGGYVMSVRSLQIQNIYSQQLIKLDNTFNTVWVKRYENSAFNQGKILQAADSSYVLYGTSDDDIYLVKSDQLGVPVFTNTYSNASTFKSISDAKETSDQGFIILGRYQDGAQVNSFIIKTNSVGVIEWAKNYESPDKPYFQNILQTPNGGYLISGYTWTNPANTILLMTDSVGNILWNKIFSNVEAGKLRRTNAGDYFLFGSISQRDTSDYVLIKVNSAGDTLWTRSYGLDLGWGEYPEDAIQTLDDGFLICGRVGFSPSDPAYIVKTDPLGFTACNIFQPVFSILSSNYTVSATTFANTTGFTYQVLVDTISADNILDSLACFSTGIEEQKDYTRLSLFPNPANNQLTISLANAGELRSPCLFLYDGIGKLVMNFNGDAIAGRRQLEIDVTSLRQGAYYVLLVNDSKIAAVEKFMKME